MKKAIKISIPEPCHEDWAKMTPTEKGKFCGVCTKEVFDFTQTSDEELVKSVMQGKNLCGRFKKSQLDREVKLERKSGTSLLPYAASLLMPLSMLATDIRNTTSEIEKPFVSLGIGSRTTNDVKSMIQVSGYIRDEYFNPIANVSVVVLETGVTVKTNSEGFYLLKCTSGSSIQVVKKNLMTQTVKLGSRNEKVNFSMYPEVNIKASVLGKIAPPEVITEEVTMGDIIEEIEEEEEIEEKQDSTNVAIKGTVTDESDLPLPGVNVIVKGTTSGTQTDFDGNYEIEAEPNQTLLFSYLSYKTKEITLSNINNEVSFAMEPDDSVISLGIVVTGGISISEKVVVNPYQSNNYFDEEQQNRRDERRAYTKKVNAFKKVKAARAKAARLLRRNSKKNK